jgi:hypothetical protein
LGPRRQQKLFEEDNPDADLASSWLSQLGSTGTSATSGQSSAEEPAKRAKTAKPKQAMGSKKVSGPGTTSSTDGETNKLQDEIKQLQKVNEKMKKTVGNMKKLSASNKKAQQENAALKAIIAQGGRQADVQLSGPTSMAPLSATEAAARCLGGPQSLSELQKKPLQTEPNSKSKPKPKAETETKPRATAKGAPAKTEPKPDAIAPAPAPVQPPSPLKRPPSLHVMAQRAKAISPGRTRSDSSPGRGASA